MLVKDQNWKYIQTNQKNVLSMSFFTQANFEMFEKGKLLDKLSSRQVTVVVCEKEVNLPNGFYTRTAPLDLPDGCYSGV